MAPSVSSSSYSTLPRRSTPQSVSPRTSPESQEPEESATAAKQTNDKRRCRSGTIAVGVRASPSDFYESSGAGNGMTTLELARHASQATMWYTTVPQSIQPQHLGSRHTPSRRSLRHSRMVGLSKQGMENYGLSLWTFNLGFLSLFLFSFQFNVQISNGGAFFVMRGHKS